jgi:hypothetical protein
VHLAASVQLLDGLGQAHDETNRVARGQRPILFDTLAQRPQDRPKVPDPSAPDKRTGDGTERSVHTLSTALWTTWGRLGLDVRRGALDHAPDDPTNLPLRTHPGRDPPHRLRRGDEDALPERRLPAEARSGRPLPQRHRLFRASRRGRREHPHPQGPQGPDQRPAQEPHGRGERHGPRGERLDAARPPELGQRGARLAPAGLREPRRRARSAPRHGGRAVDRPRAPCRGAS